MLDKRPIESKTKDIVRSLAKLFMNTTNPLNISEFFLFTVFVLLLKLASVSFIL